jgi:hypothetical protein
MARLFCSDWTVQKPKKNNAERAVTLAPGHVAFVALGYTFYCALRLPPPSEPSRKGIGYGVISCLVNPLGCFTALLIYFCRRFPQRQLVVHQGFKASDNYNHDYMAGFNGKRVFFTTLCYDLG